MAEPVSPAPTTRSGRGVEFGLMLGFDGGEVARWERRAGGKVW